MRALLRLRLWMVLVAVLYLGALAGGYHLWSNRVSDIVSDAQATPTLNLHLLLLGLFVIVALLLTLMAMMVYVLVLSRQWTHPRQDARLDEHERRIEALGANFMRFELWQKENAKEREKDELALRKEIARLADVVSKATIFGDRLGRVEGRVDEHGRRLTAIEAARLSGGAV